MASEPEFIRVAEQLRRIAEHIELMRYDVTVPAANGPLQDVLNSCLAAVTEWPDIGGSSMKTRGRCQLMATLRVDCMTFVLSFLDVQSLVNMAATCWTMQRVVRRADYVWRLLSEVHFPLWFSVVRFQPKPTLPDASAAWRKLFVERISADAQWKRSLRSPPMVKKFVRGIHSLYFDNNELLLGSGQYNEIMCFDIRTGRQHVSSYGNGMFGHTQAVTGLRPLPNRELLTSSLDSTLRLFNRDSLQNTKVFTGHTDKVWCIDTYKDRVFSGSSDKTVRVWDLESTEQVTEPIRSHRTSISAIRIVDTLSAPLLFTGSAGNTIRVWDIADSAPRCVDKLRGHTKGVFGLQSTPAVLMSGSLDNVIKAWDPRQGFRLIYELRQRDANGRDIVAYTDDNDTNIGVIAFQCDDTKVVSGGPDRIARVWDLRMRQIVNELHGHNHWITTLQFDENKIITGSRDKTVRFWDMTGRMLDEVSPTFSDHTDDQLHLPPANLPMGANALLPAPAAPPPPGP